MTDTLQLGPITDGRPTVRGIVVIKVLGDREPGFAWCEGAGASVSLAGKTPADAARMRPLFGSLSRWQIERGEIEYWQTYTPPTISLVDRLRAAMGMSRG